MQDILRTARDLITNKFSELFKTGSPLDDSLESDAEMADPVKVRDLVLNNMVAFAGLLDGEGRMLLVNESALKVADLETSDVIGKYLPETYWWSDGPTYRKKLEAAMQEAKRGIASAFEAEILVARGQKIFIDVRLVPILGRNGRVRYIVPSAIDITARRNAERAQRQSEIKLQSLVGSGIIGIVTADLEGGIVEANEQYLKMLGYGADEVKNLRWDVLTPPEHLPKDWIAIEEARARGFCTPYEKEYFHRDGHRVPVLIAYALYDDEFEDKRLAICFVLDLTPQKEAENRLRDGERHFRLMADSMPQIVWTAKPDGISDYFNLRWYEYCGASESAKPNELWLAALHPDDAKQTIERWFRSIRGGETYRTEYRIRNHKTGQYRWHLARALPVRDSDGKIIKWFGTATDIQEQKEIETTLRSTHEQLLQSNDRLEFAVRERTQDLTNALAEKEMLIKEVHHRVKNNLNVVTSLLSLQARQVKDPISVAAFQESKNRIDSIAILHEKLYQSRNLAFIGFEDYLKELLRAVLETFRRPGLRVTTQVVAKNIFLPIDSAIPCGLIVNELVSNCLKHAFRDRSEGKIRILVSQDLENYRLEVCDDGCGIPPNAELVDRDPEVPDSSLGLQIINTLTRQLGGKMEYRHEGGTQFLMTFVVREIKQRD